MTDAAAGRRRFPTAILLTCVAIGVAGGVLLAPANWLSTVLATGVIYPITAWQFFDMGSTTPVAQVLFFVVTLASAAGAAALGILIADRLRRTGVGGRI